MAKNPLQNSMELIQTLMTEHFIERLQSGEVSPSELNTMRQFLKDNFIVIAPEKAADMGTLDALLPEFDDVEADDETTFQ